jgi:negative regulator of replication initiation
MGKVDEILKQEIDDLVATGQQVLQQAMRLRDSMKGDELARATMWVTRLGQIIRRIYGTESQQFASYSAALKTQAFYNIHSNSLC